MALAICTWLWGSSKYTPIYVERLHRGLRKHIRQPFRFLLMAERDRDMPILSEGIERHAIKDPGLLLTPGCFARLRMFDTGWQKNRGLDGTIVCLDLDIVITGQLDQLFEAKEFRVLGGANSVNPCPYNNSIFMFQAGTNEDLWADFSLETVQKIKYYKFPDDQGWFWHKRPYAGTWRVGSQSGIYAFRKPGWPIGDRLPSNARLVVFPGHRDPAQFTHLDWVKNNWSSL